MHLGKININLPKATSFWYLSHREIVETYLHLEIDTKWFIEAKNQMQGVFRKENQTQGVFKEKNQMQEHLLI